MEIGESVKVGLGSGGGDGSSGTNELNATLANPRWEYVDEQKKDRHPGWAYVGDEVWLVVDAPKGFDRGDTVLFLLYEDDARFTAAFGDIEDNSARTKWVVRTRKQGDVTSKSRNRKYPRDAANENERVKNLKMTFEASAKKARTDRVRIPLRYPTMDIAIPIVFPDYRIATPIGRLPWLGHAGLLFINGKNGRTKYYEYGRYDAANLGLVRRRSIPDVTPGAGGRPTRQSLAATLGAVSASAGHGGRIEGAYIEEEGIFAKILAYATQREQANKNPKRKPYHLRSNNCMTFAKEAVEQACLATPWAIDPRPVSYIAEMQDYYPALRYDPSTRQVSVKDIFESAPHQMTESKSP